MSSVIRSDVCIIGAGSAGLSVAAGTAQLGLDTVLIERGEMGGDCLNTGCIPSKALLAAAKAAHAPAMNRFKGITHSTPEISFEKVNEHINDTIRTIQPNDSQERFEGLGVQVVRESARFIDSKKIQAGNHVIESRYFVLATGSTAAIPTIPGIRIDKVFTNENIFTLGQRPDHLLIIGGGPIGIEMAQAHRRLGSKVTVFDLGSILPRDDPENVKILRETLVKEGINIYENININSIEHLNAGVIVNFTHECRQAEYHGSHLLVAAGRTPVMDDLGLENAGIICNEKGIQVDKRLRTNKNHIFAIGDVAGGPQFTHVAGYHAGIVIRNLCFKIPARTDFSALPWVTYTDPEVAQVGMTFENARKQYGENIRSVTWPYAENDRAIAEQSINGQIKVVTNRRGRVLGASIVGQQAGELIQLWGLAISTGLKISAVAGMISPYPTLGEINKRVAGAWYTDSLFSPRTRKLVKLLQKLPL